MAERIITPGWLILRQAMYGSRVTPLSPHKYAHGKKYEMIMLSGHFKTLILSIAIQLFELTQIVTEIPLFLRPVYVFIILYVMAGGCV